MPSTLRYQFWQALQHRLTPGRMSILQLSDVWSRPTMAPLYASLEATHGQVRRASDSNHGNLAPPPHSPIVEQEFPVHRLELPQASAPQQPETARMDAEFAEHTFPEGKNRKKVNNEGKLHSGTAKETAQAASEAKAAVFLVDCKLQDSKFCSSPCLTWKFKFNSMKQKPTTLEIHDSSRPLN